MTRRAPEEIASDLAILLAEFTYSTVAHKATQAEIRAALEQAGIEPAVIDALMGDTDGN